MPRLPGLSLSGELPLHLAGKSRKVLAETPIDVSFEGADLSWTRLVGVWLLCD